MEKNLDTDFVVRTVLTALSKAFDFILHDLLAIIDYCPLGQMLSTASSLKKNRKFTLFAKDLDQMGSPVQTVYFYSNHVRMELGVSKCGVLVQK